MRPIEFFAYHGTSKECAELIVNSGTMKHGTTREDHWLGKGSYFFREDYEQAKTWAEINPNLSNPKTVIEANLKANQDKVLHLDTRQGLLDLKKYVEHLQRTEGMEFFRENKNDVKLVHYVLSSLSEESIWLIIKTFDSPAKIDKDEGLLSLSFIHRDKLHMFNQHGQQVCLRNNKAINSICEVKKVDSNVEILRFTVDANRGGKRNAIFKKSRRNVTTR